MVAVSTFRKLAVSFDEVTESPHFQKQSYRIRKKIFATLDESAKLVTVKLSELDQSVYCELPDNVVYQVPNKWGKQGWTYISLRMINKTLLKEMLTKAYCNVAPNTLSQRYLS